MGTALLLPADNAEHAGLLSALASRLPEALPVEPVPGPPSAYTTRVCAALPQHGLTRPVTVVAFGQGCALLPSVALALRTRHVEVAGYVLVDPVTVTVSDVWPDAPVSVFADRPDPTLALRGWPVQPRDLLQVWTSSDRQG